MNTHPSGTDAQLPANYASFLIECIELAVAPIPDPRDRLARQVGMLHGTVRNLCAQLDEMEAERDFAMRELGEVATAGESA